MSTEAREYQLPNGDRIHHVNPSETDYMYAEIFRDQCYVHPDLRIPNEACIFDVGANIGMFSLFALRTWSTPRVYAFEPISDLFAILQDNLRQFPSARAFNLGIAADEGANEFRFYPQFSMLSGKYADSTRDKELIRHYIGNLSSALDDADDAQAFREYAEASLDDRFGQVACLCDTKRLSSVMREVGVAQIDLLKIDAEGCELEILEALDAADWPRIAQTVIEVDDTNDSLARVVALLDRHGFRVDRRQSPEYAGTGLNVVFGLRR